MDIENHINKLRNLPQYKDKSEDYLRKVAMVTAQKKQFSISSKFNDDAEAEVAEKLFDNYLNEYDFSNYIELQKLGDLIYQEILKIRIEKKLNQGVSNNKDTKPFINDRDVKLLSDTNATIDTLRKELGIIGNKEKKELDKIEELEECFQEYIEEHRHEFSACVPFRCPKCNSWASAMYLFRRRVKDFDVLSHVWYAGRWLFNYPILRDVKDGNLSKEKAAEYLVESGKGKDSIATVQKTYAIDYIDYCLKNWNEITSFIDNEK